VAALIRHEDYSSERRLDHACSRAGCRWGRATRRSCAAPSSAASAPGRSLAERRGPRGYARLVPLRGRWVISGDGDRDATLLDKIPPPQVKVLPIGAVPDRQVGALDLESHMKRRSKRITIRLALIGILVGASCAKSDIVFVDPTASHPARKLRLSDQEWREIQGVSQASRRPISHQS
jgi:hypothetical protein